MACLELHLTKMRSTIQLIMNTDQTNTRTNEILLKTNIRSLRNQNQEMFQVHTKKLISVFEQKKERCIFRLCDKSVPNRETEYGNIIIV